MFKGVLNGNVCLFVVNEMNVLVQECLEDVLSTIKLCNHEYIIIR